MLLYRSRAVVRVGVRPFGLEPFLAHMEQASVVARSLAALLCRKRAQLQMHSLPQVLLDDSIAADAQLHVLAVHVRNLRLAKSLAVWRAKLRVKYGRPGRSVACDTDEARRDEGVAVGAVCFFLADAEMEPFIRLRLVAGGCRCVVGRAAVGISQLPLHSPGTALTSATAQTAQCVGRVDVSVSVHAVEKGELRRYLALAAAHLQRAAALVSSVALAEGVVVEDDAGCMEGRRLQPAPALRRFRLQGLCGVA